MENTVLCFNKGCGRKFRLEENKPDSCQYHPGVPVFHDALKGWSCCSRRSTDFTEFLNIPGCTLGIHNGVKPTEPEKKTVDADVTGSVPQLELVRPVKTPTVRPSINEPLIRLQMKVSDSLNKALANRLQQLAVNDDTAITDGAAVTIGASCKNNGCLAVYENEESNAETCCYHPGVPVFHEGLKYWSCCQHKTTDFNTFLSQGGCCDGKHVWKKKNDDVERRVACRFDWHQTASHVTISVYAKLADPSKTSVEVNKVTAKISVVFDDGKSYFNKEFILRGVIDPSSSIVNLLGTKVEVNLRKLEPGSWSSLEHPATVNDESSST